MHDAAVDGSGRQDQPGDRLLEGSSAEQFVQKLRELSLAASSPRDINGRSTGSGLPNLLPPISLSSNYTYLRLKFDVFKPEVSFRLPPLPYAIQLLGFFEEGFCDYHWMLRRRFRERLLQMYADPRSQAHDQAWLCCVSIIMALGETYSYGRLLDTAKGNQTGDATEDLPPGAELFEQGLLLLRNPLEEARVEDVVALNLAAFYCYSLNRRKTAYLMAGQSVRVALLLRLHEPWPKTPNSTLKVGSGDSGINSDRIEAEHRKRVWWTSYCMDNMVSTEFGFSSGQDAHAHGDGDGASTIPLPSNEGLCDSDREEFYDGQVLAAQIGLCRIKALVIENVTRQIRSDSNAESSDAVFAAIIRYMDMLRRWQSSLPADMS
ncbi:hypothetical protein SCUCBS95973_008398 [Sporothrix curviconia]|uniref:Xylanolytic transcriptional activator regulatory domain-containing protein n=1 Tax=Sporothrix curviconia TaxID=1260050 RepID=A0ABP0CL89_9PEZI